MGGKNSKQRSSGINTHSSGSRGLGFAGSSTSRSFGGGVVGSKQAEDRTKGMPGGAQISGLLDAVRDADPSALAEAASLLHRYMSAIVKSPKDDKYRKIRKGNTAFQNKLSPIDGIELLFEAVGFESVNLPSQDGVSEPYFVLPSTANVDVIKTAETLLKEFLTDQFVA